MKDIWYSDSRDIVKWGTVVWLAKENHIKTILHIAYYRADPINPRILLDPAQTDSSGPPRLPPEVIKHFPRELKLIKNLEKSIALKIDLFDEAFSGRGKKSHDRALYMKAAVERIKSHDRHPLVVLLDPDTGLEPTNTKPEHATKEEVKCFYKALKSSDFLVLYQHARRKKRWEKEVRNDIAASIRVKQEHVKTASCKEIAKDVVLFFVQGRKPPS